MKRPLLPPVLAALLAVPALSQAASGDAAWEGEWRLAPDESEAVDPLIDLHLKDRNFAARLVWKRRLQAACRTYPHLDLILGQVFSVTFGNEVPADAPADGKSGTWKRSDGETFAITVTREPARITQVLQGSDYALIDLFTLRSDGALDLQVTYTSPRLTSPFSYRLVYRKAK